MKMGRPTPDSEGKLWAYRKAHVTSDGVNPLQHFPIVLWSQRPLHFLPFSRTQFVLTEVSKIDSSNADARLFVFDSFLHFLDSFEIHSAHLDSSVQPSSLY